MSTSKRSIRDLERQCKKEPDNLVLRLLLAAAYREAGRTGDAVPLYRSVADSYQRQGRKTQAVAVLKSLLEIDPADPGTRTALDDLDREPSGPTAAPPAASPEPSRPSHPGGPGARVLAQDVVVRDLAPVRPPGVPATVRPAPRAPSPSPASTLTGIGAAGPRARQASPSRGSSALYTPTPLPAPIPFHEVEVTGAHARAPSDADVGDDVLTRVADVLAPIRNLAPPPPVEPEAVDPDLVTPPPRLPARPRAPRARPDEFAPPPIDLAADLDTRPVRRLTEKELGVVASPPPGMTARIDRVEPDDLDDQTDPDAAPAIAAPADDEPTRLADELPVAAPDSEGPTGVREAIAPAGARPARPPSRGARALRAGGRGAAIDRPTGPLPADAPDRELDEPTRVADDSPAARPTGPLPRAPHAVRPDFDPLAEDKVTRDTGPLLVEEATDVRGDGPARASAPGMHRSRTFSAQSFAATLDEMDPDGAAIEGPLDVFSILPPDALAELSRRSRLRRYAAGDLVVREGDPGDACYVIADGEVRVLKSDPIAPEAGAVEVARLGPRSLFGEMALLADRRRHATVEATTPCDLYEIPRQLLRELAASYAEVGPALESFYRQRLLATLLRTAPFFAPLPEDYRTRLLARFVPVRAESGEPIVREGQPAGGLYLIVIGAVEITRRLGKQRSVILATLREGAYFGEMSLLSGEPTSATVVAAGAVELALLPPRDFYEIVAEHPPLWAAIRSEARTRALETARLLAGATDTV